ncbi:alpha/beta hydrolase [Subtercola sp. YIM 133946]|uniref:alpha/beta hydrolase n=1 Tax=Subtercola sp. YIM 133946 TaxID=3118909 RepID=UPI002F9318A3
MPITDPAPPFDTELQATLAAMPETPPLTLSSIPAAREALAAMMPTVAEAIGDRAVSFTEVLVPGPAGQPAVAVTVLRPREAVPAAAGALVNFHGGGMMVGNRFMDTGRLVDLVLELGVVAVNVEYRLAPEHPHPAPVEDCYAALVWVAANAMQLGVDPDRIVVMGGSAGGGLSAGVALLARDRGGPALAAQLLLCPMIDNLNSTVSSRQCATGGTWTLDANLLGWQSLLGGEADSTQASIYAAPSRATDLAGLPPAFIEVGSAELFRDEDVDYASRLWAAGGQAELHVWSGGFHGFDMYAPGSALAAAALDARLSWLRRVLGA